jgi:predicted TPR repeat methyltransferase
MEPLRYILAPYVATPADVVDRMLRLAGVGAQDTVLDLGCGDGRVAIAAARDYAARGLGVDIESWWIDQAQQAALAAGVSDRVRFELGDALHFDLSGASVVFIYLVDWSVQMVAARLRSQLAPGARIVSLSFPIKDWAPARTERFVDSESVPRVLYLWQC